MVRTVHFPFLSLDLSFFPAFFLELAPSSSVADADAASDSGLDDVPPSSAVESDEDDDDLPEVPLVDDCEALIAA